VIIDLASVLSLVTGVDESLKVMRPDAERPRLNAKRLAN
jgi:hypothetical protein